MQSIPEEHSDDVQRLRQTTAAVRRRHGRDQRHSGERTSLRRGNPCLQQIQVNVSLVHSFVELFRGHRTVVSYVTTEMPVFSMASITGSPKLTVYDSLDEDVLKSYYEYSLASLLFYAMKENACSEQSARMSAMDSASKNAGEMISQLTLKFNRTRQAVITRELIEIISGAAAL